MPSENFWSTAGDEQFEGKMEIVSTNTVPHNEDLVSNSVQSLLAAVEGRMVYNKANSEAYLAGYKKYTVYSSDSLTIEKDRVPALDKLLSHIASAKIDELVDTSVSYLDGFDIRLVINAFGVSRILDAHSPSRLIFSFYQYTSYLKKNYFCNGHYFNSH